MDVDLDESLDPIDLISSQEPEISTNPSASSFRSVPPDPAGRKSSSTSSVASKPNPTHHQTGKTRRKVESDEEDPVPQPPSQSIARPRGSKESSPPSEQESKGVKPAARGPQPAPFKRRTQPGDTVIEKDKTSTSAPKLPGPQRYISFSACWGISNRQRIFENHEDS
ncbi:hypothetical protein RSAG8_03813, partial [Rhizoctonia solani AG-8 WAC10335]